MGKGQLEDVSEAGGAVERAGVLMRIWRFYYEGFRSMRVGKTLWLVILIKLFIMFAILRVFFFPNFLNSKFDTSEEKSEYVLQELTNQKR